MNNLKSYTEYAVTSSTTDFVIGFDFNYGTDAVNVTVDDVPATEAGYTVVYLNSTTMRLTPAVTRGVVRLQRETDIDTPDNRFTAGAKFIASNMDENFSQVRQSQQEVRDGFNKLSTDTYAIIDTLQVVGQAAQDAADAAESAAQTANDAAAQVNDKISYQDLDDAVEVAFAPVTDYIALPFKAGKSYALYERVQLANGDVVQSIISGNTANPNNNMNGWINTVNTTLLKSSYFGITGTGDETSKVQALVTYVNNNASVTKVSIDSNITSSQLMIFNRGIEIDFNGHTFNCTFNGDKFTAGVFFKGVVATSTYATLTVDNAPLSNKFTVNNASIFKVGDYVSATYNRSVVASATYASEDIVFTAKILNISGNDLYLDHTHGFGIPIVQPWGTAAGPLPGTQLAICKSYPIFNPKVKGFNFSNGIASTSTRLNAVTFYICIGAELSDVTATGIGGQALHNIGCRGTKVNNLSTVNPRATTGGRGYVVQENGSHDSEHDNLTGLNARHTHDASTMSSRIKVKNSRGIGSISYSFGCHSSYIHDVTIENCDGSGGFHYGNSSNGNPTDGYFGGAVGEITLKNVSASGEEARIYLSPLVSVGTNRIIDSKIQSTSQLYGVRISANTTTQNCQFVTRLRVNKHQAAAPTILTDTECTFLEGGQTDVVSQPDIIMRGGVIQTAQYLASLTMDSGASIRNATSTNLLAVGNFKIQGGSIEVTGATSDFTLTANASISESTNVVIGRYFRAISGNIELNSKNTDAEIIFTSASPVKLTATGAYIRNLNMGGGGANCKLQINNSELNYVTPKADFNYVVFTGNKVNAGTMPVAATRYIVVNNLTG